MGPRISANKQIWQIYIYEHEIMYSAPRNTLAYQPLLRSNPQTASNTTPSSLLRTSMAICYDVHHQSQFPTQRIYIWIVNTIPSFISLSFPETRPRSTFDRRYPMPPLPSPVPEVVLTLLTVDNGLIYVHTLVSSPYASSRALFSFPHPPAPILQLPQDLLF
jgi:hypothetical protein